MTWIAFATRPPCVEGQRKIMVGSRHWATGIMALYTHFGDPVPLAEALGEYFPHEDRYHDWAGPLPTHWHELPDTADIHV